MRGAVGNTSQVALFINARMNQMDMELRKEAAIHNIMSAGRSISVILPKPIATIVFDELLVSGKEQAFRVRPRLFDSHAKRKSTMQQTDEASRTWYRCCSPVSC